MVTYRQIWMLLNVTNVQSTLCIFGSIGTQQRCFATSAPMVHGGETLSRNIQYLGNGRGTFEPPLRLHFRFLCVPGSLGLLHHARG